MFSSIGITSEFAKGETIQALIAIKCLDEGVNIPSIKTAFILASTTNPKEYIQRRGRVLRKFDGKDFAVIYDFITIPKDLNDSIGSTESEMNMGKGLVQGNSIYFKGSKSIFKKKSGLRAAINIIRFLLNLPY